MSIGKNKLVSSPLLNPLYLSSNTTAVTGGVGKVERNICWVGCNVALQHTLSVDVYLFENGAIVSLGKYGRVYSANY